MKRSRRRRIGVILTTMLFTMGLMVGPAAAHVLVVDPPGTDGPAHVGWTGGGALPGQGEGLVPGGPPHDPIVQSPAHVKGLNNACEALRSNGKAAVDMFGPPTPAGCPHGT